jgi:hypothetical protein
MLLISQRAEYDSGRALEVFPCTDMTKLSNRFYVAAFFALILISSTILLIASTAMIPAPAWGGYLDVAIVVLLALTGFSIYQRSKSTPRYDASYQVAIYLFPLILVSMWLYRNTIDFNIFLPGVAWRTYFFLSLLPHALGIGQREAQP